MGDHRVLAAIALVLCTVCAMTPARADEPAAAQIARALAAGPAAITASATVVNFDAHGKMVTLRKGNNGWTCIAGHPGVVGEDPICADQQAMIWAGDMMAHKPKPTSTKPGIAYMLAGGHDWSATDPWATKGTPFAQPPHWMILWPYDPKTSGLSATPSMTGTWIMWAGTPYAHLMINQKP
jgi:hypothetical protein